ncbi:MAG: 23S rRNA (guanosine(2251)-2'-O)-methyltransferase RlmB [Ignavibacteriales bacterium CG_4_9_14_3_um_filter_34_10]|nr:MAG: 23S rRNA (guanosine(2251)-2'-O)-methyltransferase RlmB [Ignavibacteriales bacterium CG_4_9_14_3_um_filter_34_10]
MLSKLQLKEISSLSQKKNREAQNSFLIEGRKLIYEGLKSDFSCKLIIINHDYADSNPDVFTMAKEKKVRIEVLKNSEFKKISETVSPQGIAAVFEIPKIGFLNISGESIVVALENISDPGNLGTIIRTCDWFGIENILLSEDCVDLYNPKVIRSTMGSIFHVTAIEDKKFYSTLTDLKQSNFKILTAHMKGLNVFDYKRKGKLVLSFCNEANGPTQKLQKLNDEFLNIPAKGKAESLNVASAAAIIISAISNS